MIPVIPTRIDKKVIFANCAECAKGKREGWCNHEQIRDRSFTVTSTSQELEQFLLDGSRILKVYQVFDLKLILHYRPKKKVYHRCIITQERGSETMSLQK